MSAIERDPQIYQAEPVDTEKQCQRWVGGTTNPERCENQATHVFVYEKNPERDDRDNCLSCDECTPDVWTLDAE